MTRPSISALLGIELPIIQAPMAGVQGAALAVAVSNAGGLGSLPAAMLGADALRGEIRAIRAATSRPFNVNFFCHEPAAPDAAREAAWRALLAPYYAEYGIDPAEESKAPARAPFSAEIADALEDSPPPVVSFHFGLPPPALLERVRGWGSVILGCATTVEEALWLESRGVHAIVAQGWEAGGHRGLFLTRDLGTQTGTSTLVPRLTAAVRVPVIAAGGIADGAGVAAAITLGAAGAQIGTAYLLCPEATTSAPHRAALAGGPDGVDGYQGRVRTGALAGAAARTEVTNLFSGRPARGIVNRLMRELGALHPAVPAFPLAAAALAPLRARAESTGSGDFSPLWSGANPHGCRDVPAADLTRSLVPA
jgi:nitronate monooxygenase